MATCASGIWSYFAVSAVDNSRHRVKVAQRAFREVHGTATNLQRKRPNKSTSVQAASVRPFSH